MAGHYDKLFYKDYEMVVEENRKLKDDLAEALYQYRLLAKLNEQMKRKEEELQRVKAEAEAREAALKEKITELQREVDRLNAIRNTDGTNSGLPTSQTPIGKKKVIPNSRKKSEKAKGGQVGHTKQTLKPFEADEVNEIVTHIPDVCPVCGGKMRAVNDDSFTVKDELDYKVVIVRRRHFYSDAVCESCGHRIRRQAIPEHLKEPIQYGADVQACALTLMNIGSVSMNKVKRIICGMTDGGISFCEGYVSKLQARAADGLKAFIGEVRAKLLDLPLLYWDDTVIGINTARGCMRFYGNDRIAMYTAHLHKDKAGLDEDGILPLLPATTIVVHDHNIVNYNSAYAFGDAECNVHLLRDLQKATDNARHEWSGKLAELIRKTDADRNAAMERHEEAFPQEYVERFNTEFEKIMVEAADENAKDEHNFFKQDECALIVRLMEYRIQYFAWVACFDIPFSNNLSERALRGVKSKMKIAGQFQNEASAKSYAVIKTYIETCRRNQINETEALVRLCRGYPYTLAEILDLSI